MVLSWDLFAAHPDKAVNARASILSVRVVFIPSEIAGQCEPLDKRIFRSIKRRVRWRHEGAITCPRDADCTIEASMATWLEVWNAITHSEVNDSWDRFRGVNQISPDV
jgi:hypothetical protein